MKVNLLLKRVAREFSGAFTGTIWDAYLEVLETDYYAMELEDARAEIERLLKLKFPQSVRHRCLLHLAQYAVAFEEPELTLEIVDQLEESADLPAVHMIRATQLFELEQYEDALKSINQYTAKLGGGPGVSKLKGAILFELGRDDEANGPGWTP